MNRRIAILKNTFIKRSLSGSLSSWLLNTFSPPANVMAGFKIARVDNESVEDYNIYIKGITAPLVLKKGLGIDVVHHVVAEQLYTWHWHYYEIPETMVEPDDVVFDCGSAEGIFALMTHDRAGKVFAFEPLDDYVNGLRKTFLKIPNVTIVDEALGDKVGKVYFNKGGIASSVADFKTDYEVRINTIDNFSTENNIKVDYIKADIEGYEMQLLTGGKNAIKQFKPKIAITVYHEQNNTEAIKKFLSEIVPEYKFKTKGVTNFINNPVMLHAWVDK